MILSLCPFPFRCSNLTLCSPFLSSLISHQAIRIASAPPSTHASPSNPRRKSGSGLTALTSASPSKQSPTSVTTSVHLRILRNLLPQLIALSRSLSSRIDENPTAQGVGTAFRLVSAQLEASFVAWSSQFDSIMAGLRLSEGGKGRSKDRLGLIPIWPAAGSEGVEVEPATSVTQRSTIDALSLTRPSSPTQEAPPSSATNHRTWAGRRRSSVSNADQFHQIDSVIPTESPVSAKESPAEAEKQASKSSIPSRSTSPWGWNGSSSQPSSIGKKSGTAYKSTNASRSKSYNQSLSNSPEDTKGPLPPPASVPNFSPFDIVIMPTQRVPRYVLLLRDLARNTPEQSVSSARVQQALDQVSRIALLCDSASKMVDPIPPPKSLSRPTTPGRLWA